MAPTVITSADFFNAVFGDHVDGDAQICIWTFPDRCSKHFDSIEQATVYVDQLESSGGSDVYFGCGLYRPGIKNGRGKAADVVRITALWADIDYGPKHKKNVPPDEAAAMRILDKVPFKASIIVSSGHGYHAYWTLKEPVSADDGAAALAEGWCDAMKEVARIQGFALDSVGDLARLLRPPGTTNRKDPVDLRSVEIMGELNADRRYEADDLRAWAEESAGEPSTFASSAAKRKEHNGNGRALKAGTALPEYFDEVLDNWPEIRQRWNGNTSGLKDTSASAIDLSLATLLAIDTQYDDDQIWAVVREGRRRRKADVSKLDRPDYRERTLAKARESAASSQTDQDADDELLASIVALASTDKDAATRRAIDDDAVSIIARTKRRNHAAYARFIADLRSKGVKIQAIERSVTADCRKYEARIKQLATEARTTREDEAARIKDAIEDAPVSTDIIEPGGWNVSQAGVARINYDEQLQPFRQVVAPTPILIVGRLKDVHDGSESVRIAFWRDARWQHETVPRSVVANKNELVKLADKGLPVNSKTAGDLMEYFSDFEAVNIKHLPIAKVSAQMGWQQDGAAGFLLGRTLITAGGMETAETGIEALPPEDWKEDFVAFKAHDVGDDQLADGYHAAGTLQGWIDAINQVSNLPRVMLALYASFVPPLLPIIRAANFIVSYAGPTSGGKTTVLRAAASVWGCPDERQADAAIGTWDATRVYIMRSAAARNHLPLILDDTKRAKHPRVVSQTLYDVSSGRDRGRGSLTGTRRSPTFHTVMLSSGEEPVTSYTRDGGQYARVLSLWGAPFGQADDTTAPIVHGLTVAIARNFGHAGKEFVRHLVKRHEKWGDIRDRYAALHNRYVKVAGADPVRNRQAGYLAAIELAAELVHTALDLPWKFVSPVDALLDEFAAEAAQADVAVAALRFIDSWMWSNEVTFIAREAWIGSGENTRKNVPNQGYSGRWDNAETWKDVRFFPSRLREILDRADFRYDAVLKAWKDKDWLITDRNRLDHKGRLGDGSNNRSWFVVILRTAFESLNAEPEEDAEEEPLQDAEETPF